MQDGGERADNYYIPYGNQWAEQANTKTSTSDSLNNSLTKENSKLESLSFFYDKSNGSLFPMPFYKIVTDI